MAFLIPTIRCGYPKDSTLFNTHKWYALCRRHIMLPQIVGARIPNSPWDAFVSEQVLEYFDGPRLLLQRSRAGQLYLAWWNDSEGPVDRWIYLPVSRARLREILSGSMAILNALNNPEDGSLLIVDVHVEENSVIQSVVATAAALPQDSLPLEDSRLDIPIPMGFIDGPTRDRVHQLDVRVGGEAGEISADVVSRLVGNFQGLLDAVGQALSGITTPQGPVPNSIRQQTRMNLVGTYAGSLGLRFEIAMQDDTTEDSIVHSSLEGLFGLLETDQPFAYSAEHQELWSSRVAANYRDLLTAIEMSSRETSIAWNQYGENRIHELKITPEAARNRRGRVGTATKEILHLDGIFEAGNIRTGWFRFLARDSRESFRWPGIESLC